MEKIIKQQFDDAHYTAVKSTIMNSIQLPQKLNTALHVHVSPVLILSHACDSYRITCGLSQQILPMSIAIGSYLLCALVVVHVHVHACM